MATALPDRIEKKIQLDAPRSRVWRALTDAQEFGAWFGVALEGAFSPGAKVVGKITNKGYEHVTWNMTVDKMEAEHTFSFHWLPYAIDPDVDYSSEKPTLVTFTLEAVDGGTLLTVVESGFDHVPLARRAKAFEMNDKGWTIQMTQIEKYLQNAGK